MQIDQMNLHRDGMVIEPSKAWEQAAPQQISGSLYIYMCYLDEADIRINFIILP